MVDKLNFLTAGIPIAAGDYVHACDKLRELELDGMELEFVHGVRMSPATQELMRTGRKVGGAQELIFTAHSPYYINLNAKEPEKIEASIERILDTARMANSLGGYSITYHAGFYLGQEKRQVFNNILAQHQKIVEVLEQEENTIWIRPETTGKASQWGDIDEIIELCANFKQVLPCVDFSHIHARSGGDFNTYDDFCAILDKIAAALGDVAIKNFHAHIAGIAYTAKGERNHLNFADSDMNYKDLLRAMKKFGVCGAVVCESPSIESDCRVLKDYYNSL